MKRDLCIVYEGKLYLIVNIMHNCSHSLRGLCGLKLQYDVRFVRIICHSLRGLCGLKLCSKCALQYLSYRHSLRGLCGLKCIQNSNLTVKYGHSLRGLCGLKYIKRPCSYKQAGVTVCEDCVD